jgi:hypothetical protein
MSNFTDGFTFRRSLRGKSLEVDVTIVINRGKVHYHLKDDSGGRWPMSDDEQVKGNIHELLKEGRKRL